MARMVWMTCKMSLSVLVMVEDLQNHVARRISSGALWWEIGGRGHHLALTTISRAKPPESQVV
jgi:hypothetical protein